jgi:hypothetical protein
MIRDRDRIYGGIVTRRLRAMGIRDKPAAPVSPWQNGFAERLIGSIRLRVLGSYRRFRRGPSTPNPAMLRRYYNDVRTHRSLDKDAPVSRPVQRTGSVKSFPILGGLHHHYARVQVLGTYNGGKAVMNHADGIKPLTKEVLARIYPGMSVAGADIHSLHGHVQPPWAGRALRVLGSTFASFTSWRLPRS